MDKLDLRTAFTSELLHLARGDQTLFAVTTDSRGSVTLESFANELPGQFVECGIAEQDAVGIAAGLANGGLRPFACGPACFYSLRAAEQIKVDIAYTGSNVKVVGVSGGISYGALGTSHHATQDIALLRAVPGIEIYLPSDAVQMRQLTRYLAASPQPAYVRMGRGPVPVLYDEGVEFTPGRAHLAREGGDVSILACGEMVYHALEAARILSEKGIEAAVYDMFSIRPLDEQAILRATRTGLVITLEEHSIHGGLGAAIAEILSQQKPTMMRILGLPDEQLYNGASADVLAHYGLDGPGVAAQIARIFSIS